MLVAKNRKLDVDEDVAMATLNTVRVKDAAVLDGIAYEEALERRKEVRYWPTRVHVFQRNLLMDMYARTMSEALHSDQ